MIHIPSVVDVPVPAEDVFAYLSDPATNPEWSPNALEVSDIPDGPTALGTRYRVKLKFFGRVNFLIDEFEPGHRVRFNCDPPGGQLPHRFIIDQIPGHPDQPSCRVRTARPRSPRRADHPVLHQENDRRPQQADGESRSGGGRVSVGTSAQQVGGAG